MTAPTDDSRLARRLGLADAIFIGLGAMLGAGIFAAIGPAADAAGSALLVSLGIAAVVAYCNATSSAQLAAVHPASGGTYVYGRERLGHGWGFIAGWAFVVGKTASCAAMALTVGAYAAPSIQRPIAIVAVASLTAVNYFGVQKTAALTRVIAVLVLVTLATVVVSAFLAGTPTIDRLDDGHPVHATGVLQAAGFLFFAFAGYARIATLGEEVRDPQRTIPRAVPIALGIVLVTYLVVACTALAAVGSETLARSTAPLASVARAGDMTGLVPIIRAGGAIAATGVLLSMIAGVSRTAFAMADDHELPHWLAAVHPVHRVPHRADLVVGGIVIGLVSLADVRSAIGFSAFCVLWYYAIANAAAWTLPATARRWPRALTILGMGGCVTLACTLPASSVIAGIGVLSVGSAARWLRVRVAEVR